jgi:hypothetical protein
MGGGSLSMSPSQFFHRQNERGTLTPYLGQGTPADDRSIGVSALCPLYPEWRPNGKASR